MQYMGKDQTPRGFILPETAMVEVFYTGLEFRDHFFSNRILADYVILHTPVPVTTFNTSSNLGINVVNYRPGDEDLGEIGIADYDSSKYRFRGKPSPNIQLYPDGRVVIEASGFFVPVEESHPGALQLIREAVTVNTSLPGLYDICKNTGIPGKLNLLGDSW